MLGVVQAQTSHSANVLWGQRSKKKANVDNLIGDMVVPKDVTSYHASLFRFGDIGLALGEDGIAVVDSVILG